MVRFAVYPCFPVIQNWQFILHPTWEDMHIVVLSLSGMITVSMYPFPGMGNRYFFVPSWDVNCFSGGGRVIWYCSASCSRFACGILVIWFMWVIFFL